MRIICPNCDAQYEVPDEVIPPEGRDVQCSDCGTTWMHEPPDHPGTAWAETEAASEPAADVPQDAVEDDAETAEEPPDPGPRRRELDPAVAGILREEARREADARARDTQPESLETQPDLGLPEGEAASAQQAREARERRSKGRDATGNRDDPASDGQAQGTGPEPAADTGAAADTAAGPAATPTGSRKELLPDIEEINSTLRSSGERDAGEDLDTYESGRTRGRRGFQRGFLFAVLVFMIAALAYQFAPEIAQAVPQADPWISAYVTWIDDLRMMTDQQVRNLLTWLDNLSTPDI